jgi:hypothetical protein
MRKDIINEYGVVTDESIKKIMDVIYDGARKQIAILAKEYDLTPPEMMIIQRNIIGMLEGLWADRILRKQMEMKNNASSL